MEIRFLFPVTDSDYQKFLTNALTPTVIVGNDLKVVERMPEMINVNALPQMTSIPCWSCGLSIRGQPIFVPKSYNPNTANGSSFRPDSVFCTLPCMHRYYHMHGRQRTHATQLTHTAIIYFGKTVPNVPVAPDPTQTLSRFGVGSYSEDEYRDIVQQSQKASLAN